MTGLDIYPGYLLRRLNQTSTAIFARLSAEAGFDLTPVQFAALRAIEEAPGLDQRSLAERVAADRVTIGGVIDRLVRKKLVRRRQSKLDRRSREVFLTEEGGRVLAEMLPLVDRVQAELTAGLTPADAATLAALLRKALGE